MVPAAKYRLQNVGGSQNEEVVQWLEFPPSLRIGHGHTVSGLPEYITAPPPLVDFALYFIALYAVLGESRVSE